MKNKTSAYLSKPAISFTLFISFSFVFISSNGQTKKINDINWNTKLSGGNMFIENTGQFSDMKEIDGEPLFCIDNPGEKIVFTKKGLNYIYTYFEGSKNEGTEKNERKEEMMKKNAVIKHRIVSMNWQNANPNVQIVAEGLASDFYYFRNPDSNEPFRCNGYKKIIYKNIYDGIDVVYTFHKDNGFKYNIIIHPNADVSKIAMLYSKNTKPMLNEKGDILIITDKGTIIDHAPYTYSALDKKEITSSFSIKNHLITFKLDNYDPSQEIVIDPWTISPGFTAVNKGYDILKNSSTGELYAYGGYPPYELKKYSSAGTLIWTYVTSSFYDPGNTLYGDIAIDPTGNLYISNPVAFPGSISIIKIDGTTASVIWTDNTYSELWRLAFDNANNRLVAGGYVSITWGENVVTFDPATGLSIATATIIAPFAAAEVRSLAMTPSGNILMLHVSPYGAPPDASSNNISLNTPSLVNIYALPSNYLLGEEGAYYAINDISGLCATPECAHGINAFATTPNFIYTYDGNKIVKRNISTGAVISSVVVAGALAEYNSGIAIDSCENVYVGTSTGITQYDKDLVLLSTVPLGAQVFDIIIGGSNEVLACGNGFVTSTAFFCNSLSANITSTSPTCSSNCNGTATVTASGSPPYTYSWNTTTATTATITNLCSGTYIATVTDSLGNVATVSITISALSTLNTNSTETNILCNGVCSGSSATITTGGATPYSYLWSNGQTTATVSSLCAGAYTCITTDANGCIDTQSVIINQPSAIEINYTIIRCKDNLPNAEATAIISGGTPGYSYLWNSAPTQVTANASALSPGSYTVIVSDNNNCVDSLSIFINECPPDSIFIPNVFTPNSDGTNDIFIIYTEGYKSLHCEIFNRWGIKIYEWDNLSGGWNGTIKGAPASDGVYYYIYKGQKYLGDISEGKGFLQLIRD